MELASFRPYFSNRPGADEALVLQQIRGGRGTFNGFIGLTTVGTAQEKQILPHEKVLHSRFKAIAEALLKTRTINKPVLLGYPANPELNKIAEDWTSKYPGIHQFVENQTTYTYWVVDHRETVAKISALFLDIQLTYIADGHHRMGAIRHLYENNLVPNAKMLSALFSFKNLRINPYHRMVVIQEPLERIMTRMEVYLHSIQNEPSLKTLPPHTLAVQHQDKTTHFRWRPAAIDSLASNALDAQLFDQILLREIFQITDASTSDHVIYYPDDESAAMKAELLIRPDALGFYLPPVQVSQFMHSCEHGIMMPPKSTYFEPRMISGHLHHKFALDAQD